MKFLVCTTLSSVYIAFCFGFSPWVVIPLMVVIFCIAYSDSRPYSHPPSIGWEIFEAVTYIIEIVINIIAVCCFIYTCYCYHLYVSYV